MTRYVLPLHRSGSADYVQIDLLPENHIAAISLHFLYYNFCRTHQTLRVTPAMATGVTDRVWEISDIVKTLNEKAERVNLEDAQYGSALSFEPRGYQH